MSEHSLPPDPASWSTDPYRLLGVERGVSARDLRKAYLHLIRSYKPERSPEEFKRIREAYDAALPYTKHLDATRDRGEIVSEPGPEISLEPFVQEVRELRPGPRQGRPVVAPDPWELACRGDSEAGYRALVELQGQGNPREETYLQLYWLLIVLPNLEPARPPIDWLVRGLGACGAESRRLRELLKREIAADPSLALGERMSPFFRRRTPPLLALEVAELRWRAARGAERWGLILADVHSLRSWLPEFDQGTWARVLIAAAANLSWAEKPDSDRAVEFSREVEQLGHRQQDFSDDLYQVEYAQIVRQGLGLLGGRRGESSWIFQLLSRSWDETDPEFRRQLRSYVDQIARDPFASLVDLDRIQATAPAVLGRLSTLLGGLDFEGLFFVGQAAHVELVPLIERFLTSTGWTDYPALRAKLLQFCLREAVSPGLVARMLAERPEFILTGKNPLSHAIMEDWPLRHLYRACEMMREGPTPG